MSKGDTNGTLVLAVKRGDEITIEYSKTEIINKINSYFGYQLINQIKIQTFNSEKTKIKKNNMLKNLSKHFEEKINTVKNEKIKNSLSQLLEAIKND